MIEQPLSTRCGVDYENLHNKECGTMNIVPFVIKSSDNKPYNGKVTQLLTEYFNHCGVGEHLATIKGLDYSREYVFKFNMGKVTSDIVKKPHLIKIKTIRENGRSICLQVGAMDKEKGAVTIYLLMPDPKVNINNLFNLLKDPVRARKEVQESLSATSANAPKVANHMVVTQAASVEDNVRILLMYIDEELSVNVKDLQIMIASVTQTSDAVPVNYLEFLQKEGYIVETPAGQWQLTTLGHEQIAENIEEEPTVIETVVTPQSIPKSLRADPVSSPVKTPNVQERFDQLASNMDQYQKLQANLQQIEAEEVQLDTSHKLALEIIDKDYKKKKQSLNEFKQAAKEAIKPLEKSVAKFKKLQELLDLT